LASGDALAVPQAPAHRLAGAVSSLAARLATHRGEHHAVRPGHGRDLSLPLPGRTDPLPVAGGMTGPAGQPPGMGLGRARCVATRMAGSEVRAGETDRSKGRHRAPARPYYYLLEDDVACWLLNAQHLKNVPGRKTDVADAAWIAQLVEHGLVRPSFVPPRPIGELRELTRYRKALIYERTRETQRLHKLLEDAGIKLGCVASDVLGSRAGRCWRRWSAGPPTPRSWPSWPGGSCARSSRRCGGAPGPGRASPSAAGGRVAGAPGLPGGGHRAAVGRGRAGDRPVLAAAGVADDHPGVDRRTAEVILAEIGTDMTRFPPRASG
jgi:Transposase